MGVLRRRIQKGLGGSLQTLSGRNGEDGYEPFKVGQEILGLLPCVFSIDGTEAHVLLVASTTEVGNRKDAPERLGLRIVHHEANEVNFFLRHDMTSVLYL